MLNHNAGKHNSVERNTKSKHSTQLWVVEVSERIQILGDRDLGGLPALLFSRMLHGPFIPFELSAGISKEFCVGAATEVANII